MYATQTLINVDLSISHSKKKNGIFGYFQLMCIVIEVSSILIEYISVSKYHMKKKDLVEKSNWNFPKNKNQKTN